MKQKRVTLRGQHKANVVHLKLLRGAIESGDPKTELLIRVEDMLVLTHRVLASNRSTPPKRKRKAK